jgi:hypothetical protein
MASFAENGTRPDRRRDDRREINRSEIDRRQDDRREIDRRQDDRREIDADLQGVVIFIHQEYDERLDPCVVDQCLDQVAARFIGATVRSFVPLLVARYVRDELHARLRQA